MKGNVTWDDFWTQTLRAHYVYLNRVDSIIYLHGRLRIHYRILFYAWVSGECFDLLQRNSICWNLNRRYVEVWGLFKILNNKIRRCRLCRSQISTHLSCVRYSEIWSYFLRSKMNLMHRLWCRSNLSSSYGDKSK